MKPISFIQPNLKYLNGVTIYDRLLDTYIRYVWNVISQMMELVNVQIKDIMLRYTETKVIARLGHTILYDTLINDYATNDIVMIYHGYVF